MAESNERSGGIESAVREEAVRKELDKILSSAVFQTSERRRNFLRYTVEQTILGHGDLIKEYTIGTIVFGRSASFDPRLDTIVRTEARKLRARLDKYYETDGKQDPLRIEFRRGTYAPLFRVPTTEPVELQPMPDLGTGPPEPQPEEIPPIVVSPQPHRASHRTAAWLTALMLAAAATAASVWLVRSSRRPPLPESPSVAVLPFLNLSDAQNGKTDDFLSDGLTDELIDSLGRVPGLHVVARTSAFQYKDRTVDIRKVGRDLNVRNVLEGTVRKSGNRLRITAELDDTTNGYRVWSQSYDEEMSEALAIQQEISRAITSALGVRLSRGNGIGPQASGIEVSAAAHTAYLKGRFFWNKLNSKDMQAAIGYFQQALGIDPNYAEAREGLAHCYTLLPVFSDIKPPAVIGKIRESAEKALALDPTLGEAHLDLAMAFEYDFDWTDAEKEFQTGLALNPGDAVAHRLYSVHLLTTGKLEEALAQCKIGLNLDPISPFMAQGLARCYYFSRRYSEAVEEYQDALALDPGFRLAHWGLGTTLLIDKMYSQGLAELVQTAQGLSDASAQGHLAYGYAITGHRAAAEKILAMLEKSKVPSSRDIARIYIGLGNKDRAFEWLDKSLQKKEAYLYLKVDPVYDPLRSDPRFENLLRQMHLI